MFTIAINRLLIIYQVLDLTIWSLDIMKIIIERILKGINRTSAQRHHDILMSEKSHI